MKSTTNKSVLFWDFDGVILNSMAVRDIGFIKVLSEFPKEQVDMLLSYHRKNGGLSRYVKFRYFFEEIRNETISKDQVFEWANKFSIIMKELLINKELLITEVVRFIAENYKSYIMHIVSGSDQTELRYLCKKLGIDSFFKSIHGSPTPKTILVKKLINSHNYNRDSCVLIGDSGNDFDAADDNNIEFLCYNNPVLSKSHREFEPSKYI